MNSTTQLVPTPRPDVTKRRLKNESYVVIFTSAIIFGLQAYMFISSSFDEVVYNACQYQAILIIICSIGEVFTIFAATCALGVAAKKKKVAVTIPCLISTLIALAGNIVFVYFAALESRSLYDLYMYSVTPVVIEACACGISGILLIELIFLPIYVFMIWCRKNPSQTLNSQEGAMNSAPVAAQQQIYIDAFQGTQIPNGQWEPNNNVQYQGQPAPQTNDYINAFQERSIQEPQHDKYYQQQPQIAEKFQQPMKPQFQRDQIYSSGQTVPNGGYDQQPRRGRLAQMQNQRMNQNQPR